MRYLSLTLFLAFACLMISSISGRRAEKTIAFAHTGNYFTNVKNYLSQAGSEVDYHESGDAHRLRNEMKTWLPRLSPSGDISTANEAINKYNCSYQFQSSSYTPNWTCIGPTGKPLDSKSTGNGQVHRIIFDPNYDGIRNFTMYCVSNFGGAWISDSPQVLWKNLNTDTQLPFTTVADMTVHPQNSQVLMLATGDGDYGRIYNDKTFTQLTGYRITPTQTSGIYRSLDAGKTWNRMNGPNNQFCHDFSQGGNMRRIIFHPYQPMKAYVATTKGIFTCDNTLSESLLWKNTFRGELDDTEMRGIDVKPDGVGRTVYASGSDVYKSEDFGSNWKSMTGPGTGLDLKDMPLGQSDFRINVAVTEADPDRLYAYLYGINDNLTCEECKAQCRGVKSCNGGQCTYKKRWAWAYIFKAGKWHKIFEQNSCNPASVPQRRWMAIAASPINPNHVFLGTTVVYGNSSETTYEELLGGKTLKDVSGYNSQGLHADVHALTFEPLSESNPAPRLFAGTHGGVSVNSLKYSRGKVNRREWKRKDKGLQVATIWDFGQSLIHPEKLIIATQDNGVIIHMDDHLSPNSTWKSVLGGDGYGAMFDGASDMAWVKNSSGVYRFDYDSEKKYPENEFLPRDPIDKYRTFVRYLNSVNHPETGQMFTAFGELYERPNAFDKPVKGKKNWRLKSDIGKKVGAGWKREIYSFGISESDPKYMYIVCTGNDAVPPKDYANEPRIFRSTKGGCVDLEDYGDPKGALSCFEEISTSSIVSDNPGDTRLPYITSLAIQETDPNKIWITFSGYESRLKVWSWDYDLITKKGIWANADPAGSLNNLPVNFIVHQKGTLNRLYIGTDAGIYIKDENETNWKKYGAFPNVRVTGLHANYCSNQLVAATFGRSVWTGDMLPMEHDYQNELLIRSGERHFWIKDRAIHRNVRIEKGAILKIENCTVSMSKNTKIEVDDGGLLALVNATVTNNCGEVWQGIVQSKEITGRSESQSHVVNQNSQILYSKN